MTNKLSLEEWIDRYHSTHAVCHDGVSWMLIRLISNYLKEADEMKTIDIIDIQTKQLASTQQALNETKGSLAHMTEVAKIRRDQLNVAVIGFEAINNELIKGVISWPSIKTMIKAILNAINRKENAGGSVTLLENQVISLQQALDIAVEALKFYADENNWHHCGMGCGIRPEKYNGEPDEGETAQEALASIKE